MDTCKFGHTGSKVFACDNEVVEGEQYCYAHLEFSEADGRMVYTREQADRQPNGVKGLDQSNYPIYKDLHGVWRLAHNDKALDGFNGIMRLEDYLPFWVVG